MRFDVAIKNLITQNTAIADEIAGIYPVVVPANVSAQVNPVLVYNQVSTSPISTKSQYGEYDRAVIQLSIFCKSLDKCQIIAASIRAFLDRYSGTITVAGTDYRIDLVRFQNQEFVGFDEDNDVFMIAQDYQFAMTRFWTFGLPTLCGSVNAAKTNATLRVEDFPLLWLIGNGGAGYYDSYKGDTFEISGSGNCLYGGSAADYASITEIDVFNESLSTNFNNFLGKFSNLDRFSCTRNSLTSLDFSDNLLLTSLVCSINSLTSLDISNNILLTQVECQRNSLTSLDISNNVLIEELECNRNNLTSLDILNNPLLNSLGSYTNPISDLDISNNPLLLNLRCYDNKLNNLVNSQILIDLDSHGLSNGYFQSSIFGGGSLTTAGAAAKSSLQSKGWNIVGL
jgi:hypothetical protein